MTTTRDRRPDASTGLPWGPLLALTTAVLLTSLTETLPAGLLPQMSADLDVSASSAGQTVTVYAAGTALTAIPLVRATARIARRTVLLAAVGLFAAANVATALSPVLPATLAARFVAGVAAGLAWAVLAGYARALAPAGREGTAVAVAMAGIPVALSVGVPAGTWVAGAVGWRTSFGLVAAVAAAVVAWIALGVPGVRAADRDDAADATARRVLTLPGVPRVMTVVLLFVLGHTVLYAYVAPVVSRAGLGGSVDAALLVFGVAGLLSIWLTGRHVDRHLRVVGIASAAVFTAATAALALDGPPVLVWITLAAWGLGWGGAPTWLQTGAAVAALRHGPAAVDTSQAVLVTLWNAAMALGGIVGGLLLADVGVRSVPVTAAVLGLVSLVLLAVPLSRHVARGGAR